MEIVRRVLELRACGWGQPSRPLTSTPLGQHVTGGGEGGGALLGSEVVVGAAEVPSEANVFQMPVSNPGVVYNCQQGQNTPVVYNITCCIFLLGIVFNKILPTAEEWNEFLDDDNQLIEERGQPTTER